jgi:alanyl-tRNA synthetase
MVGMDALSALFAERDLIKRLSGELKAPAAELEQRILGSIEELRLAQKKIADLEAAQALGRLLVLLPSKAQDIAGKRVLAIEMDGIGGEQLRQVAIKAREELGSNSVVVLGSVEDGRVTLMVACGQAAIESGIKAGDLARVASAVLGGGGGGKPDLAQGGGSEVSKLDEAISAAVGLIK